MFADPIFEDAVELLTPSALAAGLHLSTHLESEVHSYLYRLQY